MKTKSIQLIILFFYFLLFTFHSVHSQNEVFQLGFTGAYPSNYDWDITKNVNWSWYKDELKMNVQQGWWVGEGRLELIDSLYKYGMGGYFMPDTLRWAAWGRQIILQAEDIPDRFSYADHNNCGSNVPDNSQFGTGQLVRHYSVYAPCGTPGTPVQVLDSAKENGIQSICAFPVDPAREVNFPYYDQQGGWHWHDTVNTYYVKPRMRINVADAFSDPPKNVAKIVVKAYNGDVVGEFIIKTNYFRYNDPYTYDGRYLEEFWQFPVFVSGDTNAINRGRPHQNPPDWGETCHADYQLYWYGEVSVWIDYVKVQDQGAHLFFDQGIKGNRFRDAIKNKVDRLWNYDQGKDVLRGFYIEEVDYTNLATLKALQDSLTNRWGHNDPDYRLIGMLAVWSYNRVLKDRKVPDDYDEYLDAVNPRIFLFPQYPHGSPWLIYYGMELLRLPYLPDNISFHMQPYYPQFVIDAFNQFFPNPVDPNLPRITVSKTEYNNHLQAGTDAFADSVDFFRLRCEQRGIKYYIIPGIQYIMEYYYDQGQQQFKWALMSKEPMNSEISVQFMVGICRGAKGILPFNYESNFWNSTNGGLSISHTPMVPLDQIYAIHQFTMTDWDAQINWGYLKRAKNFYNEDKWEYVKDLYNKINKWGPILANSTNTEGFSVNRNGADHYYIDDIQSTYQLAPPNGPVYSDTVKYWEMGFFTPAGASQNEKYFMFVNRRCVPGSDWRWLGIKFDTSALAVYRNWKIKDVYTGQDTTFDKLNQGAQGFLRMPSAMKTFQPGEGKLFKLTPVMQSGGTLQADEVIPSGSNLTCEDTVISNGKNITISGTGTTISFTDSATIIMDGATFQSSSSSESGPQKNTFKGSNSHNWNGLRFNSSTVKIYNSKFENIASPVINYAVSMIDCPLGDIRNNQFIIDSDTAGGVSAVYSGDGGYSGLYINYNTFTMNNSRANAIQVQGFADMTFPVYVENNIMSSGNATGIFLSSITGGVVNYNELTGFSIGINSMYSTIDLYGNTITNTSCESKGIFASSGGMLNLSPNYQYRTGGSNTIVNTNGYSKNLHVVGSLFDINDGRNSFDILSSFPIQTWHLYGYFPAGENYNSDAYNNCFKYDGVPIQAPDLPNCNVLEGEYGSPITFNFIPYSCSGFNQGGSVIADIGNGLYDTIPTSSGGSGGGVSSENEMTFVLPLDKALYDSICVQVRFKNYNAVKNLCYNLINNFPDSIESIASLTKLYLSVTFTDTTAATTNALKTYYQNLILNHSNNITLVKSCNYLVQKCKVRLKQYQSALNGFQQIINQNPYSYEGLLARWDYMATSLLIQGQGGGEKGENTDFGDDDHDKSGQNKSPFTKQERKFIVETIINANQVSRNNDEAKVLILEENARDGDVNAVRELKTMKVLKDVNKTCSPRNILEHIQIVSNDIQKVFTNPNANNTKTQTSIPSDYNLYQNYPNPFNPVTKINYDLPKDVKVSIGIYDILGREVRTLVNNEFKKAGQYTVDFNGTNLASGVYFYRIEAGEFLLAKKMVLIK